MNTRPLASQPKDHAAWATEREVDRGLRGDMQANSGNGRSRTDKLIDSLLVAGIIALVTATIVSYVTAVKVETAFTQRNQIYDREIQRLDGVNDRQDARFDANEAWQWRHEQRINELEQGRGPSQRNPDDRSKRR